MRGSGYKSQGDQDLCAAAAAEHLIFKTSPEEQTVDLTNKCMTMDSQRFSRWFHSAWRTTGAILLTCSCRWMHEGADLRSYMGGCVRSGTSHQKHKAACFARAFPALTDMRSERHSHFAFCSLLTSNNDAFTHILDGTHDLWCAHIKNTRIHRKYRCFWFLALHVELHFHTL